MVDLAKIPRDRVGLWSSVVVIDLKNDETITYKVVTSEEADVNNGKISASSPIGRGLIGKEPGDTVRIPIPGGSREFEIVKVTTIHDETE